MSGSYDSVPNLQTESVKQAVKVVCSVLGNIEPLQITNALDNFIQACKEFPINKVNLAFSCNCKVPDYSCIRYSMNYKIPPVFKVGNCVCR